MPSASRSPSLSSLSSEDFIDDDTINARAPGNSNSQKGFEVVIDKKTSPKASGDAEYESFPDDRETKLNTDGEEVARRNSQEEEEEIVPDHWYGGGKIPVFKPTMKQFESFKYFVDKINHYGMKSGIVKIIAPKEWLDALPRLDEKIKDIKIKNPIVQHINGNAGMYRQENVEKQRTYSLPEWRKLCEAADHQPPARRGERRLNQAPKVQRGMGPRSRAKLKNEEPSERKETMHNASQVPDSPLRIKDEDELDDEGTPAPDTDSHGRQPRKSGITTEPTTDSKGRQPRNRRRRLKDEDYVDDSIWENFDYRIFNAEEYTPERCEELEKAYWRTLTYNNPLYGADMPGSLFDDSTTSWNVAKLENLLDCLGQKLPGVNTAYLYLGMWKSTFAWHLEDVDLYSINYIHFGAPKQWYSICQEDAPKFEAVMKSIWPQEAKKCDQFLRHKTFLVSPSLLQQNGIRVNKLVHHQGEFVITFPYGYHSGYNLGYNCAESVNFATESWLEIGRIAKKCLCIHDAVWVDVGEIEKRLRGEVTEDEEEVCDDEIADAEGTADLPTPPESIDLKPRRKRQRTGDEDKIPKKRIKKVNLRVNLAAQRDHCILCPNDIPTEEMLPTDNGKKAHRLCAIYTPETYFAADQISGKDTIYNIAGIPKSRLELRCVFCKISGRGACFQCSAKKCARAYHATCAAAAGVLVEMRDAWAEDAETGKPVMQTQIDFLCRYHRPKRNKDLDSELLEENLSIAEFGRSLIKGDVIQMQFFRREIFAGVVVENRLSEETVLVDVLPKGFVSSLHVAQPLRSILRLTSSSWACRGIMEVEWKWILATDPAPPAAPEAYVAGAASAAGAQPPPQKAVPGPPERFGDGDSGLRWAEFVLEPIPANAEQAAVDPAKNFWYYLGEHSTEYIAKYSADPARRVPCGDAAVLPKPAKARPAPKPKPKPAPAPVAVQCCPPPPHPQGPWPAYAAPYAYCAGHPPPHAVPGYPHPAPQHPYPPSQPPRPLPQNTPQQHPVQHQAGPQPQHPNSYPQYPAPPPPHPVPNQQSPAPHQQHLPPQPQASVPTMAGPLTREQQLQQIAEQHKLLEAKSIPIPSNLSIPALSDNTLQTLKPPHDAMKGPEKSLPSPPPTVLSKQIKLPSIPPPETSSLPSTAAIHTNAAPPQPPPPIPTLPVPPITSTS
ncbi:hypothetical protein BDZ91DRAFT_793174 [Kalaharituber pfeilii]|nr:hypothetical protein BDZ91DRAFT_793174 [Kalaharituber pfeilii]